MRQGSVLSPTLFLIVMDEMLKALSSAGDGVSIAGLYLGSAAYADDIRTLSQTIKAAEVQAEAIMEFTLENGLSANAEKTEVIYTDVCESPL